MGPKMTTAQQTTTDQRNSDVRKPATVRARRASKIAHYAMDNDLTLKAAALQLRFVNEEEFDRVVDPAKMVKRYVAAAK